MHHHISRRSVLTAALAATTGATAATALAGCGDGVASNAPTGTSELPDYVRLSQVTPDFPSLPDGPVDGFKAYPADPVTTITTPPGDGSPVTGITNVQSTVPVAMDRNPYWQELNKRLGSELRLIQASSADYANKLATVVAGDTLPDLSFLPTNTPNLKALLEAKAYELSGKLGGSAVKDFPALANIPTAAWKLCRYDGGLWAIPLHRGTASTGLIIARDDLLRANGVNGENPADFDSFVTLCKEINRPKENVFALTCNPINYMQTMWNLPNGWSLTDGKLKHTSEYTDQWHEAIQAAQALDKAGVIRPDAVSSSTSDNQQALYAGKGQMMWDSHTAFIGYYNINAGNPSFAARPMPYVGHDGGDGTPQLTNGILGMVMVNKKSQERIDTLLKVVDFFASPFGTTEYLFNNFGIEGEEYDLKGIDPVVRSDAAPKFRLGQIYLGAGPYTTYLPGHPDVTEVVYNSEKKASEIGAFDPTLGYYSQTAEKTYAKDSANRNAILLDVILDRENVSALDTFDKNWLKGNGAKIKSEYEADIAKG